MNATVQSPAASSFLSHALTSNKREWSMKIQGWTIVLTRSEPTKGSFDRHDDVAVDSWTAEIVSPYNATRFMVTHVPGLWAMSEKSRAMQAARGHTSIPSAADHTRIRFTSIVEKAKQYVEALARLTVMVEKARDALPVDASKKTRKQFDAAGLALMSGQVVTNGRDSACIVAGETVFVVACGPKNEWRELVYTVGDEAVHGSYNLAYIGTITSVSPKTIKIVDRHGGRAKMLTHAQFMNYNDRPIAAAHKRNAEWMD
jgi:ribosomal protein L28